MGGAAKLQYIYTCQRSFSDLTLCPSLTDAPLPVAYQSGEGEQKKREGEGEKKKGGLADRGAAARAPMFPVADAGTVLMTASMPLIGHGPQQVKSHSPSKSKIGTGGMESVISE